MLGSGRYGITVSRKIGSKLKAIKLVDRSYSDAEFELQKLAASTSPYVADIKRIAALDPDRG